MLFLFFPSDSAHLSHVFATVFTVAVTAPGLESVEVAGVPVEVGGGFDDLTAGALLLVLLSL